MKHLALLAAGASTLAVGGLAIRAMTSSPTVASLEVDDITSPGVERVERRRRVPASRPTLAEVASMDEIAAASHRRREASQGHSVEDAMNTVAVEAAAEQGDGEISVEALARQEAMENAAIATLRSIAAAQQQLQASALIDTDADGGGDHGYFAELAGAVPLRISSKGGPTLGGPGERLDPTFLPKAFGDVEPGSNGGVVRRQGYVFQLWLPANEAERPIRGIAEASYGGAANQLPGPSNAEVMWCCYAWPEKAPEENTGAPARAFLINQSGDVIATDGAKKSYVGLFSGPAVDAGFSAAGDMGSEQGLAAAGLSAQDGNIWAPVGN